MFDGSVLGMFWECSFGFGGCSGIVPGLFQGSSGNVLGVFWGCSGGVLGVHTGTRTGTQLGSPTPVLLNLKAKNSTQKASENARPDPRPKKHF